MPNDQHEAIVCGAASCNMICIYLRQSFPDQAVKITGDSLSNSEIERGLPNISEIENKYNLAENQPIYSVFIPLQDSLQKSKQSRGIISFKGKNFHRQEFQNM